MELALERCIRSNPPKSFKDLAGEDDVSFYLQSKDCKNCEEYGRGGGRERFEEEEGLGVVVRVDVGEPAARALAQREGVTKIPAYVVVGEGKGIEVRYPRTSPT